jgi:heme-degrading monooxygenase HmoA
MIQAPSFLALSRFTVANGMTDAVKDAFRSRPHRVEAAPGFTRMEVISPQDRPQEIWLLTYWQDRQSFEAWHHSHLYQESHKAIPKGLKLIPGETEMRFFDHICS